MEKKWAKEILTTKLIQTLKVKDIIESIVDESVHKVEKLRRLRTAGKKQTQCQENINIMDVVYPEKRTPLIGAVRKKVQKIEEAKKTENEAEEKKEARKKLKARRKKEDKLASEILCGWLGATPLEPKKVENAKETTKEGKEVLKKRKLFETDMVKEKQEEEKKKVKKSKIELLKEKFEYKEKGITRQATASEPKKSTIMRKKTGKGSEIKDMGGRGFITTWPTGQKNEQEGGGDKIQNRTEPN